MESLKFFQIILTDEQAKKSSMRKQVTVESNNNFSKSFLREHLVECWFPMLRRFATANIARTWISCELEFIFFVNFHLKVCLPVNQHLSTFCRNFDWMLWILNAWSSWLHSYQRIPNLVIKMAKWKETVLQSWFNPYIIWCWAKYESQNLFPLLVDAEEKYL